MLIDSHAHLTSPQLEEECEGILLRAQTAGIEAIINICTNLSELEKGLALSQKHSWVYNAGATTPHDVDKEGELYFDRFSSAARSGNLIAIGETGLDYHHHHASKQMQQRFLRRYLELALECGLPVIIHCREAFTDFFQILRQNYRLNGKVGPGVLHCFTGTLEEAEEVLDHGFYLSLSGIVTFKKSEQLREVARLVPLDRLLIETDAPYLAPQSKRGKLNEPAFLEETAKILADVKKISLAEISSHTTSNAKALFKLP